MVTLSLCMSVDSIELTLTNIAGRISSTYYQENSTVPPKANVEIALAIETFAKWGREKLPLY